MECEENLNESCYYTLQFKIQSLFISLFSPDKLLHLNLSGQQLVLELVDGADAGHGLYPRPRAPGMRSRVNTGHHLPAGSGSGGRFN